MAEETLREIFAKKLNLYMSLNNKNQADLSKYMNVSSATASDWCNGNKMPRTDKIQMIAKWLGVGIGDMLEESTEEYYLNEETKKVAQEYYENKKLALVFDASRTATPEDLDAVHTMLLALKKKEKGE